MGVEETWKKEEESSYSSVMLNYLGFLHKNVLSCSIRDVLVTLGLILWFLISLTKEKLF